MTNFSLEKWQTGKYKVVTSNGKEILDFSYHPNSKGEYKFSGVVPTLDGICTWKTNGKYSYEGNESCLDIYLQEPEMWVNLYDNNFKASYIGRVYNSYDEAKSRATIEHDNYLGTFKLVKDGE